METKKRKKIIIIITIVLAIVIIASAITAYVLISKNKANKNSTSQNAQQISSTIFSTNMYNEAIAYRELRTTNYSGTYKYKQIYSITFNYYSEDNPSGLTDADIKKLLRINYKGVSDINSLLKYLGDEKLKQVNENEEVFNFRNVMSNGNVSSTGLCTISTNTKFLTYSFYGDDDLALIDMNDNGGLYMSLNYSKLENAYLYTNLTITTNTSLLYMFKDVYDVSGSYKLFTLTYVYEKVETEIEEIPSENLIIDFGTL